MSRPRSGGIGAAFDPMALLSRAVRLRSSPEKFWARFDRTAAGCWPWPGRRGPEGYGLVTWAGVDVPAHRLAFALAHRPLLAGEVVRHECDNPPCCRPAHLTVGSIADNNRDARDRGRARTAHLVRSGSANHNARLTDALVSELRGAWTSGESILSIVRRTGLAFGTIHPMLHGKTWRHVPLALTASAPAIASGEVGR